nr:hypothetical protein [Mycetocola manganoxydans]
MATDALDQAARIAQVFGGDANNAPPLVLECVSSVDIPLPLRPICEVLEALVFENEPECSKEEVRAGKENTVGVEQFDVHFRVRQAREHDLDPQS